MTHTEHRSDAAIAYTRRQLIDLKDQAPDWIRAFVIDRALTYPDPLNFWGECCDPEFVEANALHLEATGVAAFYDKYAEEIERIEYRCLRSPLGPMSYDAEYVAYFAIENTAFHLRHCLVD